MVQALCKAQRRTELERDNALARYEIRDTRYEIRDYRSEKREARSEKREARSEKIICDLCLVCQ
ncbi:hypothetical protein EH171_17895 [Enterovibrio baiacu]|nr:hypothetical protein [Enterovibrio baiacu]